MEKNSDTLKPLARLQQQGAAPLLAPAANREAEAAAKAAERKQLQAAAAKSLGAKAAGAAPCLLPRNHRFQQDRAAMLALLREAGLDVDGMHRAAREAEEYQKSQAATEAAAAWREELDGHSTMAQRPRDWPPPADGPAAAAAAPPQAKRRRVMQPPQQLPPPPAAEGEEQAGGEAAIQQGLAAVQRVSELAQETLRQAAAAQRLLQDLLAASRRGGRR